MKPEQSLFGGAACDECEHYDSETCREAILFESSGDYVMPDYQPEIRKILLLSSEICPSGQYENGGRAECGGEIRHTLVYSDAEGRTQSAEFRSDYDYSFDGGEGAAGGKLLTHEHILSVNCRLSGPRRLSIKTRLSAELSLLSKEALSCRIDGEGAALLRRPYTVMSTKTASDELQLSGEAALPFLSSDGVRILCRESSALFRETRVQKDGVLVRGEILTHALLDSGEGIPFSVTVRTPIEETVYAEGILSDAGVLAFCDIRDVSLSFSESGGNVILLADVSASLVLEIRENRTVSPVVDAFFTGHEAACEGKTLTITSHAGSECGHLSVSGRTDDKEYDPSLAVAVADCVGNAVLKSTEEHDGVLLLTGECKMRVLLSGAPDEDGEMRLYVTDVLFPFTVSLDRRGKPRADAYRAEVALLSPRAHLDGDALFVDGELFYRYYATCDEEITVLTEAAAASALPKEDASVITVVYPAEGESLWQIGKTYHRSPETLTEENKLPEAVRLSPDSADGLQEVTRLFIG